MVALFQVDAFTSRPFTGNPAGVCLLETPVDTVWMQSVAAEMNLSETAFVLPGDPRGLRWFTPTTEVDLCGHATLATAHVLWSEGIQSLADPLRFETRSGLLAASLDDGWIELDLPVRQVREEPLPVETIAALGVLPVRCGKSSFDVIEVASVEEVQSAAPDLATLGQQEKGYIVTAQSGDEVVCRVFAPGLGIPEDPVTGSAQCVLAPWWVPRLGREEFIVRQLSRRGGILRVRSKGERVMVAGQAVTTVRGELLS